MRRLHLVLVLFTLALSGAAAAAADLGGERRMSPAFSDGGDRLRFGGEAPHDMLRDDRPSRSGGLTSGLTLGSDAEVSPQSRSLRRSLVDEREMPMERPRQADGGMWEQRSEDRPLRPKGPDPRYMSGTMLNGGGEGGKGRLPGGGSTAPSKPHCFYGQTCAS